MREFKQWHEDKTFKFNSQTIIYFSQCTKDGILSLQELLKLTSDIAVEDFNQRNMSRETMLKSHFMILVSRNSFRIHKSPKENQLVTVSTWEEKSEIFQFIRAYEITDTLTGEKLISGLSTWLLVDSQTRKLLPIKNFNLREPVETKTEHDCIKPSKITFNEENLRLLGERKINFSDIDANGHTNNSRYGAFIMDALPLEYAQKTFKDIRLNYSKEAMLGETLKIYADFDDCLKKITVIGKTSENSFEAELYY